MSYSETLAERVREALVRRAGVSERKMFGGLAFLLDGKMFCGIVGDELMVRVGAERYDDALARRHARPMDFTGRPMKGYVFVAPAGLRSSAAVESWVEWGAAAAAALPPRNTAPKRRASAARAATRGRPPKRVRRR